jgi:ribosome-associated translation inhibitor RaiA
MDKTITVRNTELTYAERRRLRALIARMPRYFRHLKATHWRFSAVSDLSAVSCSAHSQSGVFRARATAARPGAAMDLVYDKIVRQRRRSRANSVKRRRVGTHRVAS